MDSRCVIEVNNVSKNFKIYADKGTTAKEKLLFFVEINMKKKKF